MSVRRYPTYLECADHMKRGGLVLNAFGIPTSFTEAELRELGTEFGDRSLTMFRLVDPS